LQKSQTKQVLLSVLLGPAGLLYSSVNAALILTFLTLIGVLVAANQALFVLVTSVIASVLCGWLLVRSHNKHVSVRDFTLSTYIGRVSCKVIGKTRFKRDYSRSLAKAQLRRRLRATATFSLALLCLLLTGVIALPNAMNQFQHLTQEQGPDGVVAENEHLEANNPSLNTPSMAAAMTNEEELSNIGIWLIEQETGADEFHARLLGNNYQSTSEGFYRPILSLSCNSGQATISFEAYEVLGTENTQLTLHFDTRTKEQSEWHLQGDYRSAYTTASKPLLNKLSRSETLQISYRPFGSDENRSVDFDLGQSSAVTSKLGRQCV